MTNLQVVALILLVLAVLAAFLWLRRNVTEPLRRMFPVWAALRPFDSGEKSAAAMRYASMAVYGEKEVKNTGMMEEISKHAAAYDSNPAAWEQTRQ
ncbi:MAG: hypothetical protein COC09_06865 [Gammaproteobacteria bacterium]|nr:MAG: hypothetical protein COC09_06865 [Gammaproteobacteria bacterium]